MPEFYEFFAGGGMARAGLGTGWGCRFANDLDPAKAAAYRANWGEGALRLGDVADLRPADLPGRADLAWASFPCQDLSLAGRAAGMGVPGAAGTRSGAFWGFWALMRGLAAERRAPRLIVLENVCGLLTARGGRDFATLAGALAGEGWRLGALVIDARLFLPQSRPRLFVIAARADQPVPPALLRAGPDPRWSPPALTAAVAALPAATRAQWLWWAAPAPAASPPPLAALIEAAPPDVRWADPAGVERLLGLMSRVNRAKLAAAQAASAADGRPRIGCVFRRTRTEGGVRRQRAEVRFDGVAGCLRTPAGGSSRQTILAVEGPRVRARLLSAREAARLMGLPDAYRLPASHAAACHLLGDGVAVPVVAHLERTIIRPCLAVAPDRGARAA